MAANAATLQAHLDELDATGRAQAEQATFQARAQAQVQAWQDAVNGYMDRLKGVHEQNKAQGEAAVEQFKSDAQRAQADLNAKVDELGKVGQASWAAMSQAFDESRNAFAKMLEAAAKSFNDATKS